MLAGWGGFGWKASLPNTDCDFGEKAGRILEDFLESGGRANGRRFLVCGSARFNAKTQRGAKGAKRYLGLRIGGGWFFAGLGGVEVLGEEGAEKAEEGGEGLVVDFKEPSG